jgi:cytochrome c peroxidase
MILAFGAAYSVADEVQPAKSTHKNKVTAASPEVFVGDRLFFETRFAQYFYSRSNGRVNAILRSGDPLADEIPRHGLRSLPGPFRGRSVSCRHCHLGDDFASTEPTAQRTYCDFSDRTAIPARPDGLVKTLRNTPQMVDLTLPREVPALFHYDGEFASVEDLVVSTLTSRNMGWQLSEHSTATAHVATVIRNDSGLNPRYVRSSDGQGLPYRVVLLGMDSAIPESLRISATYRIDVTTASDDAILRAVARLIHAYMDSIRFGPNAHNRKSDSPYEVFLKKNGYPTVPQFGESNIQYARRLARLISEASNHLWVTSPLDGEFKLHVQQYKFGPAELQGLKVFLSETPSSKNEGHVGGCVICHTPPRFSDDRFHNTGVSQFEYDKIFGAGAFSAIDIPDLRTRNSSPDRFLPATIRHPSRTNRFSSTPERARPGFSDLGMWNVFANPDFPVPQKALTRLLCDARFGASCARDELLQSAIASFKTPIIRDLGHSNPYFHNGAAITIEDVLMHYDRASTLMRAGKLRNGARELKTIALDEADRRYVSAFLRSLNEDYH